MIYDQPVRSLMAEMIAELAPKLGQVFTKEAALDWFRDRYPRIKTGTIAAHLIRFSTNAPSRVHYQARPNDDLLFQVNSRQFRRHDPARDPSPLRAGPGGQDGEQPAAVSAQSRRSHERPGRPVDIERNLRRYLSGRQPEGRYASFDYCFNYFQSHRERGRLADLEQGDALETSCLHLGFYLASWGMYRGSADLLKRSLRHLVPLIRVVARSSSDVWQMDAHLYGDGRCAAILDTAAQIRTALPRATDTLVTKIMLGTFGCVPAFDTYFKNGLGVSKFGPEALRQVGEFYRANAELIDGHTVHTLEFPSGHEIERRYTRAKVIDMIFFVQGGDAGAREGQDQV